MPKLTPRRHQHIPATPLAFDADGIARIAFDSMQVQVIIGQPCTVVYICFLGTTEVLRSILETEAVDGDTFQLTYTKVAGVISFRRPLEV